MADAGGIWTRAKNAKGKSLARAVHTARGDMKIRAHGAGYGRAGEATNYKKELLFFRVFCVFRGQGFLDAERFTRHR
ncbi:MAG TPA: hypothetical protein VJ698_00220 [Noviherbaspirillum sp.]|nr:hypothetical protein [Noviherbaspirillum sp.]